MILVRPLSSPRIAANGLSQGPHERALSGNLTLVVLRTTCPSLGREGICHDWLGLKTKEAAEPKDAEEGKGERSAAVAAPQTKS